MSGAPTRIMILDVLRATAQEYSIPKEQIIARDARDEVSRARHVGIYVCRKLTARSCPVIGYYFGGRDPTTVLHAIKKIAALEARDHDVREEIARIALSATAMAAAREGAKHG